MASHNFFEYKYTTLFVNTILQDSVDITEVVENYWKTALRTWILTNMTDTLKSGAAEHLNIQLLSYEQLHRVRN